MADMLVPLDAIMAGDWSEILRLADERVLWEIDYSPCPTCGWTVYDQRDAQYRRAEVECQVCRTAVPLEILYRVEEDRVLALLGGPDG